MHLAHVEFLPIAEAAERAGVHRTTVLRRARAVPGALDVRDGQNFISSAWLASAYPTASAAQDAQQTHTTAHVRTGNAQYAHTPMHTAKPAQVVTIAHKAQDDGALQTLHETVTALLSELQEARQERARLIALVEAERERAERAGQAAAAQVERLQTDLRAAHGELQDVSRRLVEAQTAHAKALAERNAGPTVEPIQDAQAARERRAVVWAVWLAAGAVGIIAAAVVASVWQGKV